MDRLTKQEIEEWRHRLSALWMTGKTIKESQDSANALCDLALQSLSLESVRSEALKLAEEMDTYFFAARQGDADETLALDRISHFAARVRALSPARVAEGVIGLEADAGKIAAERLSAPESPAKEQPGEVHCINDPRCDEWCGGDECFVPAKQPEYDCMICGGIVHGPFIKPDGKLHQRHSGKRPTFPTIECPKCGYTPPPPERP